MRSSRPSPETVAEIRRLRQEGKRIRDLANLFQLSDDLISAYCRDLSTNPKAKYHSIKEMREAERLRRINHPLTCHKHNITYTNRCSECRREQRKPENKPVVYSHMVSRERYLQANHTIVEFRQCSKRPEGESHYYVLNVAGEGTCRWCGLPRTRPPEVTMFTYSERLEQA